MLLLWIFVFWCIRALERFDDNNFVPVRLVAHRLLRWVRSLGLSYLLLQQLLGSNSILLLIGRLVLGIGVLILSVDLGTSTASLGAASRSLASSQADCLGPYPGFTPNWPCPLLMDSKLRYF